MRSVLIIIAVLRFPGARVNSLGRTLSNISPHGHRAVAKKIGIEIVGKTSFLIEQPFHYSVEQFHIYDLIHL